jgi:hypothetical protein
MAGDWFKMIVDVADALGVGDEAKRAMSGLGAYADGRSTQTDADDTDPSGGVYVYERWLTRPRDPRVNDR